MSKPLLVDVNGLKIRLKYSEGVMMPSSFSILLARSLQGAGCRTALDMGCGCGFQAIVLAKRGAKTVFAVDKDKRCVAATEFNALLNGVSDWTGAKHSVTALHGDMFVPLEAEKFDLIVSNPPSLPHSDETPYYADGGKDGREFLDNLINHSVQHLHYQGKLCFVQSTLADLAATKKLLASNGFVFQVGKPQRVLIRPFYYPHLYFYQRRRIQQRAHFIETADGRLYEYLHVITATFQGLRK